MTNYAESVWIRAEAEPDRLALSCGDARWSYGELLGQTSLSGGAVRATGLAPGDRVMLVAPSVPEFVAVYYGIIAAGASVVAMNTMATADEIEFVLRDCDCRLILAWHECAEAAATAAASRAVELLRLYPGLPTWESSETLDSPISRDDHDTALILYTSGTTGHPKGVELTHRNLAAVAQATVAALEVTAADTFGTPLPLFHVFGNVVVLGTAMLAGAAVALMPRFGPTEMLQTIAAEEVTIFAGVPTVYNALLHAGEAAGAGFPRLRVCCTGGASLPASVLDSFHRRFGAVILEGYGLTESTGSVTFNGLHRERKAGFVGLPMPRTEVRLVDAEGREVETGEVGEVLVRAPQVMKGYHNRPEETAEALRGGWLHTGDLGKLDAEGDLQIVDRTKDMVIRGGYNVYPREVEEVLYGHPDVVEAAIIGVPDEHYGEEVAAIVALRPGAAADPEELRRWSKERLSAYKVPRLYDFVDALPKGATGKVLKREIDVSGLIAAEGGGPKPK